MSQPSAAVYPAASPTATIPPRYQIGESPGSYFAHWTGGPVSHPTPADDEDEWYRAQTGHCLPHPGPSVGNYMIRRDPVSLVSGDLPRFALLDFRRAHEVSPAPYLLGDVRMRVRSGENAYWLDERGSVETHYEPWGTKHVVEVDSLVVTITASLVDTVGMAFSITAVNSGSRPAEIDLCYGGLGLAALRGGDRPECILLSSANETDDRIEIENGAAFFSDDVVPYKVRVEAQDAILHRIGGENGVEQRVAFRYTCPAGESAISLVSVKDTADSSGVSAANTEGYIAATQAYYARLLAPYEISTPDPIVNAGFYSAVLGMDYTYSPPNWVEGLTQWQTFFCTNYVIGAANALEMDDRALTALRSLILHPQGPGWAYQSDLSLVEGEGYRDGILYTVLQFYTYWKATGDLKNVREMWAPLVSGLSDFVAHRDGDGDGLLDFRKGSNSFLYQADHVSLPGAGFSPSVMFAAMASRLAEIADQLGETQQAAGWRLQAAEIYRDLLDRFWCETEGRFISGIDPLGHRQVASYYTDYAFPALYTDLPTDRRFRSLLAMDAALSLTPCRMRTGNYYPDLFGNNGVHQVGMTEAAMAQFGEGRSERGWELLHGVAACSSVISYGPGTFYEFMSWDGLGLLNKHFSNPIGSYIQAVVWGLFGFQRTAAPSIQRWQPSIPARWESARLRIGETEMAISGTAENRTYRLRLKTPQAVSVRLPLYGRAPTRVTGLSGDDIGYTLETHPSGNFVHIDFPPAAEHSITLELGGDQTVATAPAPSPAPVLGGGPRSPRLTGSRKAVDLTSYFNGDRIRPENFWRNLVWSPGHEMIFDLSGEVGSAGPTGALTVGDYQFDVRPAGRNLLVLAMGDLDPNTGKPMPTVLPVEIKLEIGSRIEGVEFLTVAEPRVRLTGMNVAEIVCVYDDGEKDILPIAVGRQLDSALSAYATDTTVYNLPKGRAGITKHLSAWQVRLDAARVAKSVTLRIISHDIEVGILGVNVRVAA